MAAPEKKTVDYFPHNCLHGRKMHIIETAYGNDGYAVWFKLLEQLGLADYHYIDFNDETQQKYLASIFRVDLEKLKNILTDLANLGAIHTGLFINDKIIFSEKFTSSVQDAYKRRANKCFTLEALCKHLDSLNEQDVQVEGVITDNNQQSKVNNNKEDNSKPEESKEEEKKEEEKKEKKSEFEEEEVNTNVLTGDKSPSYSFFKGKYLEMYRNTMGTDIVFTDLDTEDLKEIILLLETKGQKENLLPSDIINMYNTLLEHTYQKTKDILLADAKDYLTDIVLV